MKHSEHALHDTLEAALRFFKMLLMNLYHKLMRLYSIALIHDEHDLSLVLVERTMLLWIGSVQVFYRLTRQ